MLPQFQRPEVSNKFHWAEIKVSARSHNLWRLWGRIPPLGLPGSDCCLYSSVSGCITAIDKASVSKPLPTLSSYHLLLCVYPTSLCLPLVSMHRTEFNASAGNSGSSLHLKIPSLITYAKTLFPSKVTYPYSRD